MDNDDRYKKKELKKNLAGLGLTAIIFAWFLYYLISHIPE